MRVVHVQSKANKTNPCDNLQTREAQKCEASHGKAVKADSCFSSKGGAEVLDEEGWMLRHKFQLLAPKSVRLEIIGRSQSPPTQESVKRV